MLITENVKSIKMCKLEKKISSPSDQPEAITIINFVVFPIYAAVCFFNIYEK